MIEQPVVQALGALAFILLMVAIALNAKVAGLKKAVEAAEAKANRPAPPPPPRVAEWKVVQVGLLWYPSFTIKDEQLVVSAAAGKPHCQRCVKPLTLSPGPPEEWSCAGCGDKRPGSAADLQVTDAVISEALKEFLARNPALRAGPGVGRR